MMYLKEIKRDGAVMHEAERIEYYDITAFGLPEPGQSRWHVTLIDRAGDRHVITISKGFVLNAEGKTIDRIG